MSHKQPSKPRRPPVTPVTTVMRIKSNFEMAEGLATPCAVVYGKYLQHCLAEGFQRRLTCAHFGSLLHSIFRVEGLRRRQFGSGKKSKTYYDGLQLKQFSKTAISPKTDAVHAEYSTKPSPLTLKWLREAFAVGPGLSMLCSSAYGMYEAHCRENSITALCPKSFGKLIHSVFSSDGLSRRQLGSGRRAQTFYENLHVAPNWYGIDGAAELCQSDFASKPSAATVRWFLDNFAAEAGFAIPCNDVYSLYLEHGQAQGIECLSDKPFGRLLQSIFGYRSIRRRQLGSRYNRKSYYYGIRLKTTKAQTFPVASANEIHPGRWETITDPSRPEVALLQRLPTNHPLCLARNLLLQLADDYECCRRAFLSSLDSRDRQASVSVGGTQLLIDYKVVNGNISVGLKSLCKVLAGNKRYESAYSDVFQSWCNGLVGKNRDKHFFEKLYPYREPKINDHLTASGAGHLLGFCRQSSWSEFAGAAQDALINEGLLNPFLKLPTPIKPEVQTVSSIIAYINARYPNLELRTGVCIPTPSGSKRRRILDLWCEALKLNIECNERDHSKTPLYGADYTSKREADIRSVKGDDTIFYYYNPHAATFSVTTESEKICELISSLGVRARILLTERLQSGVESSPLPSASGTKISTGACFFPYVSTSDLCAQLSEKRVFFKQQLNDYKLKQQVYLDSIDGNSGKLKSINVTINGADYPIFVYIDKEILGRLAFNRVSLFKALSGGRRCYNGMFSQWIDHPSADRRRCFVSPPNGQIRRMQGPSKETESVSIYGAEILLEYFEGVLPDHVNQVRQHMVDCGILCPFDVDSEEAYTTTLDNANSHPEFFII